MKNQKVVFLTTAFLAALSLPAQIVTGSGTTGYIPKWTGGTSVGNSTLYQSGSKVGVGTSAPGYPLDVNGNINTNAAYLIKGYTVLGNPNYTTNTAVGPGALYSNYNSLGQNNTAVGTYSLIANTFGSDNTAVGYNTLQNAQTGTQNTAVGSGALYTDAYGSANTAVGYFALYKNTADENTAVGFNALSGNSTGGENVAVGSSASESNGGGFYNTAIGYSALLSNIGGSSNVALGGQALYYLFGGSSNVALGRGAGGNYIYNETNNIVISSSGQPDENNAIHIGTQGSHTAFYGAGIFGTNLSGASVVVNSNGQLGVVNSSIRFKEDVHDMADSSAGLLRLRPVTYRYKEPFADGSKPVDYGLIAEEVAQVFPDLVVKSADGQIQTVQYQKLTPMLLNELQKQTETIRLLERRLTALEAGSSTVR